jgi:hypothetical protein
VERVRWAAWKEAEVSIVRGNLERHKLSLTNSHAQHHSIVSPQPAADEAALILPAHRQSTQIRAASLAQLHIAVEQIPSRHHPRYPFNFRTRSLFRCGNSSRIKAKHTKQFPSMTFPQVPACRPMPTILVVPIPTVFLTADPIYPEPVPIAPSPKSFTAGSSSQTTSIFDKHSDYAASIRSTATTFSMRSIRSYFQVSTLL